MCRCIRAIRVIRVPPCEAVTSHRSSVAGGAVVDCQVKCVNLCTSIGIEMREGIIATCGVGGVIPGIGLASGLCRCGVYRVIDCQVQCIDLSTTVDIDMREGVVATSSICRVIPCIGLTSGLCR